MSVFSDSSDASDADSAPEDFEKPSQLRGSDHRRRGRRYIQLQRDAKYRSFFPSFFDDDVESAGGWSCVSDGGGI
jgi:hypothetical protein